MSWLPHTGKSDLIEVLTVRATDPLPDFHRAVTAAFETTMLLRCTRPGQSRGSSIRTVPSRPLNEVLVEFNRPDAVERLEALLDRLGYPATHRVRAAGIRERRPIYQVMLSPNSQRALAPILRDGWRSGLNLLNDPNRYLSPRRRRHREHVSVAAWRAALLAAGHKRRGDRGIYIGDHETMAVLVRAGRVLDLAVTAQRRPGCYLVRLAEPHLQRVIVGNGGSSLR